MIRIMMIMMTMIILYDNDGHRVLGEAGVSKLKTGEVGEVLQAGFCNVNFTDVTLADEDTNSIVTNQ